MFQNARTLTKISLILGVLIAVSLIVSTVSYNSSSTQSNSSRWTDHTYLVIGHINTMMAAMVDQETGMRAYLLAGDKKFLEPQIAGEKAYKTNWDALKQLTSDNPSEQKRLDDIDAFAQNWHDKVVRPEMQFMENQATWDKARQIEISGAGKTSMDGIRGIVKQMIEAESSLLGVRKTDADNAASLSVTTSIVGGIVMLLTAAIGLFLLNRALVSPLRGITGAMLDLAAGRNDITIPGQGRKDEVGEMAACVEVFRKTAIDKIESDRQAAETRQMNESERARIADIDRKRAEDMAEATSGLAQGLKQLSDGDLTFTLSKPFAQEFEGLRNDFNATVNTLRETLMQVSHATGTIDSGARELSGSANDLSRRTEQQAASLEETAAALDQITTNVSNSSKRTEEARTVAMEANTSARQSGEVVSKAIDAMQRIEASSSQISNIIGVIDEIAFQTNLLALNAGVEAARAGEAGKGFAVVAQEVRELAQRSAQAAKEIKDLIRNSAQEVEGGVKLVTATGEALKIIESHVVSINTQLDAIATSAREQSVGLAEVNTAVNQMDQVTQQNAAMVEEATAASSTLASESDRLRQLISQFRFDGAARHASMPASSAVASSAPAMRAASAKPAAAAASHKQQPSPARRMVNKLAKAMGANAPAESWEEF
ncbi:methyl-accepting chemotaxis protein [Allorhizobium sp. BGMRC 0089]|uniref:methyl-accepting chemotaxis protein n=1 Tax=Allorhizobium sonneratiae TaxID=2934936 RepID=UPI00237CB62C|nr:methyl-accepting chemotaxis protein [Allorhizobium sonneratiae]MCM2290983.1 methyl-accepting chemotaxis protein [Allorhizobium sonneratiae]